MTDPITIEAYVNAMPAVAWRAFTTPEGITHWNFASSDWQCPRAEVDLREGGRHVARMEAKDGSAGFDFGGTYEEVVPERVVSLRLDDGRLARTSFEPEAGGTRVRTVFDPDSSHPAEMQRDGWQAILNNFAAYAGSSDKARATRQRSSPTSLILK